MESVSYLTLDFKYPNISEIVYAKQNDRGSREIVCQLVDGGQPWTPPGNIFSAIRYRKPDGTGGFYDLTENNRPAAIFSGSTVTLILAEQVLTVPGDVYMEFNVYTSQTERLTTFTFLLRVQRSVLDDVTIISSNYYNILTQQIADILGSVGAVAELEATAHSIPKDQEATVTVTGGTGQNDPYKLDFGIPRGYSPDLRVTRSGRVLTITATDESGTTSESITDPEARVTQDGANITITMTDSQGQTSATVLRGSVRLASFDIDLSTGQLIMYAPEAFDELTFRINDDGQLEVIVNG